MLEKQGNLRKNLGLLVEPNDVIRRLYDLFKHENVNRITNPQIIKSFKAPAKVINY